MFMVVQFNAFMVIFFSLHLRLVDLLHLWLKVVAFVVSVTFMVNSYYTYGWYNIYVFITFVGDTRRCIFRFELKLIRIVEVFN